MFATQEHIQKIGQDNIKAALAAAEAQLGALQKLASLNLEMTKANFEAWAQNARALAGAKDAQELFNIQSSWLQPGVQSALDYWGSVYGLATQTCGEISRIGERRLADAGNGSGSASATARKTA